MRSNLGDIAFIYRANTADNLGPADFEIGDRDLVRDVGLETAVVITFGTDARADTTDTLPKTIQNRGGFWGSSLVGYSVGNKLWLLFRSNITPTVIAQAKQYVKDGFNWMITEGIISKADVAVTSEGTRQLNFKNVLYKPNSYSVTFGFYMNWENQIIGGVS
jgi:phage gp46-like protein